MLLKRKILSLEMINTLDLTELFKISFQLLNQGKIMFLNSKSSL